MRVERERASEADLQGRASNSSWPPYGSQGSRTWSSVGGAVLQGPANCGKTRKIRNMFRNSAKIVVFWRNLPDLRNLTKFAEFNRVCEILRILPTLAKSPKTLVRSTVRAIDRRGRPPRVRRGQRQSAALRQPGEPDVVVGVAAARAALAGGAPPVRPPGPRQGAAEAVDAEVA